MFQARRALEPALNPSRQRLRFNRSVTCGLGGPKHCNSPAERETLHSARAPQLWVRACHKTFPKGNLPKVSINFQTIHQRKTSPRSIGADLSRGADGRAPSNASSNYPPSGAAFRVRASSVYFLFLINTNKELEEYHVFKADQTIWGRLVVYKGGGIGRSDPRAGPRPQQPRSPRSGRMEWRPPPPLPPREQLVSREEIALFWDMCSTTDPALLLNLSFESEFYICRWNAGAINPCRSESWPNQRQWPPEETGGNPTRRRWPISSVPFMVLNLSVRPPSNSCLFPDT